MLLFSFVVLALGAFGGAAALTGSASGAGASTVTTSTMGPFTPTFTGSAASGCASGDCSLLSDPTTTASTAALASRPSTKRSATARAPRKHALPSPVLHRHRATAGQAAPAAPSTAGVPPVSCPSAGCATVDPTSGGAIGVKGLNAVDSAQNTTNIFKDVEPPDQGLCAGNGYVVEANNIGEIKVFGTTLKTSSSPISLDAVMGLTSKGWSSGGDPSCLYDSANGGHWFITEIVSASTEASGGPFSGCFAAVANTCFEGIAVSQGNNPFGPYSVYYLNANYNPSENGFPFLLNDFAKISVTRDAFMLFYDEFPLRGGGLGGGGFNGAQEFAFQKSALEAGMPASGVNVAIENMGTIGTPNGTCAGSSGVDCWAAVIPAQPADASQFDNGHNGSGFMMDTLDFNSFFGAPTTGDDRIAVWDWTGLGSLNSSACSGCSSIQFGGQLFNGVNQYNDPENLTTLQSGVLGAQKAGPIPLGDECRAAGLTAGKHQPKSCPENGVATNGDFMTQASQGQGQLWGSTPTEVNQSFATGSPEIHMGVAYWLIDTSSFDSTGQVSLKDQGYVSAAHEDLEMPAIAGEGAGGSANAIILFTLSGNGGPTGADGGGFFPSTAFGTLTPSSSGLSGSVMNVADAGQSPQDGFTEYQGFPGFTRPRWGDYSEGIFLPTSSGNRIYFANEYIQSPNCTGKAFTLTIGTCGGTRDGNANWGTSVNYVAAP